MKKIAWSLLVCAGCISTLAANAAEPPAKSVRVTFAELDLRKEAGVRELYSRLKRASREVCGTTRGATYPRNPQFGSCFEETLETAVSEVGNTLLERIHRQS